MELTDITLEIHQASLRLSKGADALFLLAKANAEAERDYRRALAIEIVKLKSEGMSVTLIGDIARGNTAELKYNRDLKEAMYTSGRDSLRAISTQVTSLMSILKYQNEV